MDSTFPLWLTLAAAGGTSAGYFLAKANRGRAKSRQRSARGVVVTNGRQLAEEIVQVLLERQQTPRPAEDITQVFVTANFLRESYRHLIADGGIGNFRESFFYATGVMVRPNSFVVSERLLVAFSEQTAGGVRVADQSSVKVFNELDARGTALLAHFHTHPGHGHLANQPSATDLGFQERLERGGHLAIGGIFARGESVAHLRFFATPNRQFVVHVQGNHVRKVEENVFELSVAHG